jgi:hypothetical protein
MNYATAWALCRIGSGFLPDDSLFSAAGNSRPEHLETASNRITVLDEVQPVEGVIARLRHR